MTINDAGFHSRRKLGGRIFNGKIKNFTPMGFVAEKKK